MKQIYKETDTAKITITFADITDEERDKVLKDFAQAAYNLCLHEYLKKLKENENEKGTNG